MLLISQSINRETAMQLKTRNSKLKTTYQIRGLFFEKHQPNQPAMQQGVDNGYRHRHQGPIIRNEVFENRIKQKKIAKKGNDRKVAKLKVQSFGNKPSGFRLPEYQSCRPGPEKRDNAKPYNTPQVEKTRMHNTVTAMA